MSDKTRDTVGILMIIISILCCTVSFIASSGGKSFHYKSGHSRKWTLNTIKTEGTGPVRVNCAGKRELTRLYGIGESLAEMIITERNRNGPFYYAEDLEAVKGIGPGTVGKIRSMIDLSPDESEDNYELPGALP